LLKLYTLQPRKNDRGLEIIFTGEIHMKRILFILLVIVAFCLFSCVETKQYYTLNPDGSGKVTVETIFQQISISVGKEEDLDTTVKKAVKNLLEKSSGIDVWKDVEYKMQDDGRIYFKGTAYFKDISKLKIENSDLLKVKFKKTKNNEMVLEILGEEKKKSKTEKKKKMTEAELEEEIKKLKSGYQQIKPMLAAFLTSLKAESSFKLPGKIKKKINFKKAKDNSLNLKFEGRKLLDVLDELAADEKWWKDQAKAGKNFKDNAFMDDTINEKLFGEKGPVRAVVSGKLKPLFSYDKEVKAAKKRYPEIIKALGIEKQEQASASPARSSKFKSLKIGGIRLIKFSDSENNIRPFYYDKSYSLALIAELEGTALVINGGKLEKAVSDKGESLLPEREWDRDIWSPILSQDKTIVVFEIKMKVPSKKTKYIKEISGYLEYDSIAGTKKSRSQIVLFKEASMISECQIKIDKINENQWQKGSWEMTLLADYPKRSIKAVTFYNEDNTKLNTWEIRRSSVSTDQTSLIYSLNSEFPDKGFLEIEVYEELQHYKVPFQLKKVSLIGELIK